MDGLVVIVVIASYSKKRDLINYPCHDVRRTMLENSATVVLTCLEYPLYIFAEIHQSSRASEHLTLMYTMDGRYQVMSIRNIYSLFFKTCFTVIFANIGKEILNALDNLSPLRSFTMMMSSNGNIFRVAGHLCWRGALMFSLICAWINGWVNTRESDDLRRLRVHYDASLMNEACHTYVRQ